MCVCDRERELFEYYCACVFVVAVVLKVVFNSLLLLNIHKVLTGVRYSRSALKIGSMTSIVGPMELLAEIQSLLSFTKSAKRLLPEKKSRKDP